ncbi:hypothetical protein TNCV_3473261 [Trichonephila clavipes]|nr:hypothetical protein TNCV_3473261 [Trichonephila clavipes]
MFLAGHPPQRCFGLQSHCAPCYFFNQASFIPLISLLVRVAYILHMSLRIGDLTVLIWKAFVQSYIEKTVSSLIFAHQCSMSPKRCNTVQTMPKHAEHQIIDLILGLHHSSSNAHRSSGRHVGGG